MSGPANIGSPSMPSPPKQAFGLGIVTLVPELWASLLGPMSGVVGRAFTEGLAQASIIDLKRFGVGPHRKVDDAPFGGGAGMVLQAGPLDGAIACAKKEIPGPVVLLGPRGRRFDHGLARKAAAGEGLTLICGRYEGVDERVRAYVDDEWSVGDWVLSAGDPAAWCMIDAIVRLLPGVLGNPESLHEESFAGDVGGLEYPQYTRPAMYRDVGVPEALLSGDHRRIAAWRLAAAQALTQAHRPDLVDGLDLADGLAADKTQDAATKTDGMMR